ncbi:hypothetical protein AB1E22_01235 [Buttiauxella gaviniae]|uniref:ImpA domain-containing protein n=1 Tax=Buttiauxella gaviniae TaxID=82990 RepID=A0ABV3NP85_9ENTR
MKDELRQQPTAANYLGDYLRGEVPINQLISQHEYILNTLNLEEELQKNTTHIMLLTLSEADAVLNQLLNLVDPVATYAGNIKDLSDGARNIKKLVSYYNDANKIIYNLRGLGIKAIVQTVKGVQYVKITGYAGVRRILKGTRYAINNPQVLELGIGKAGVNAGIIGGARFCVWFSLAYRAIELIFKNDYAVVDFIGDITMDIAKIIVTIFVSKIISSIVVSATAIACLTLPLTATIFLIVVVGFAVTYALDFLDKKYHLSDKLKEIIKQGIKSRGEIEEWNLNNTSPFINALRTGY